MAYFLGMNGDSSFEKVGEVWSLYFSHVVCISPLSKLESKWSHVHLVAAFSDGRRRFLSTSSSDPETPDCLRTVTEKRPPLPDMKNIQNTCNIQVEPAYSSLGTLVLSYHRLITPLLSFFLLAKIQARAPRLCGKLRIPFALMAVCFLHLRCSPLLMLPRPWCRYIHTSLVSLMKTHVRYFGAEVIF